MSNTDVFGLDIGLSTDTIHNNQNYFRAIVGGGGFMVLVTYLFAFLRGHHMKSYKFLWGPMNEYKHTLRGFTVSALLAATSLLTVMIVIAFGDVIKPSTEIIISFAIMEFGAFLLYPSLVCSMGTRLDPRPAITALPIVFTFVGNIFVVMALIFNIDNDNKEWTAICASLTCVAVWHHLIFDLTIWMLGYRQEMPDFFKSGSSFEEDVTAGEALLESQAKVRMRFKS